ncbi:MAG: aminopeptidase [Thermomicrobiales bacterium]|nr:aminopeptidase [Thermomicrobiales bacterium]
MTVSDPWLARWAATLVGYSVALRPGEVVAISGETAAEPLLREIARVALAGGGHPVVLPTLPDADAALLALGDDAQLDFISPIEAFIARDADVLIRVTAKTNTHALSGANPARQQRHARARTELRGEGMRRAAEGVRRWSLTLFPTAGFAMDANMATADFAEFIYTACKLDTPDPAAAWRALSAEQARLIAWLEGRREIRLTGPDTDMRLSVAGRIWINSDGKRNFPSGEIFTGPVEDSATGHVRFSYPVVTGGREIADIRLRFADGRVVDASAARNEEFLIRSLDADPGARRLGEFAFGTNFDITRFTKNILLDEKMGGTVHMALGAGYPDTGSVNRSAIHWDMICDLRRGGLVTVDGAPFLRDGHFLV